MISESYTLFSDIELLPQKALFIKSLHAIVIADLHIGIEFSAALKGVFIPNFQFEHLKNTLSELIDSKNPEKLIIVGDLKHEFARKTKQELRELVDILEFINDLGLDFVLVRGNHDNFLKGFLDVFNIDFYDKFFIQDDYFFTHGHIDIELESINQRYIIMGHEHPSILLIDDVGGKVKIPVFLVGEAYGKKILVLPAFSPMAPGYELNLLSSDDILSPILRNIELDDFWVYPVVSRGILQPVQLKALYLSQ